MRANFHTTTHSITIPGPTTLAVPVDDARALALPTLMTTLPASDDHDRGNPSQLGALPTYTVDDVKTHDTPNDLWMIIYNKVYDVTKFANDHPGGVEVLYDCGGVDATEPFDDVAHSDDAVEMLRPYLVGEVVRSQHVQYRHPRPVAPPIIKKAPVVAASARDKVLTERIVLLALAMVALTLFAVYVGIQVVKWNF